MALAVLILLSVSSGVSASICTCGGQSPCQHTAGQSCYPLVDLHDWDDVNASKSFSECPPNTDHCDCGCSGTNPCKRGSECVSTQSMYGQEVCPAGSYRCRFVSAMKTPQTTTPFTEGTKICPCSGSRPCQLIGTSTCVPRDLGTGECDTGMAEQCTCKCNGATPCQHLTQDVCLPSYTFLGTQQCPTKTIKCREYESFRHPPSAHQQQQQQQSLGSLLDQYCICGGGKPCQNNNDPAGSSCYELHEVTETGELVCPTNTTKCDCTCKDKFPCSHREAGAAEEFCYATQNIGGTNQVDECPPSSKHCKWSPLPSSGHQYTPLSSSAAALLVEPLPSPTEPPISTTTDGIPRNCVFAGWSPWSPCSKDCGVGVSSSAPVIIQRPTNGGTPCPQKNFTTCNVESCDPVDCQVTGWTSWTPCTENCGDTGTSDRSPLIAVHPRHGGARCPTKQRKPCNRVPCGLGTKPVCQCDPFENVGDGDMQRTTSCFIKKHAIADAAAGEEVRHTMLVHTLHLNQAPDNKGVGNHKFKNQGYVCKNRHRSDSQVFECRCCTCDFSTMECETTSWSEWSACSNATQVNAGTSPILIRTRNRQVFGYKDDDGNCPIQEQREPCLTNH